LANSDVSIRLLVDTIAENNISVEKYRNTMRELGKKLAASIYPKILAQDKSDIYVVCTVEDADFLARGVIDELASHGLESRIKLMCLWNGKIRDEGISLSPVFKQYKEEQSSATASFIIIKSIISGACVVKTNLTRAISSIAPEQVFVVSPVLLEGAQERLSREFPAEISSKFQYVWLATDFEKRDDMVIPGIGGSIYERLGLGDENQKNKYIPAIVKERRQSRHPSLINT
jgi:hypothetical protein